MGRINWFRVVLGGLVAGFIINIGEFLLNEPILGRKTAAAMETLGRPPMGNQAITLFVVLGFVLGIGAVYLYPARGCTRKSLPDPGVRAHSIPSSDRSRWFSLHSERTLTWRPRNTLVPRKASISRRAAVPIPFNMPAPFPTTIPFWDSRSTRIEASMRVSFSPSSQESMTTAVE